MANSGGGSDYAIVAETEFIRSTRDTGYKSVSHAVAELIDNSLQARSDQIDVVVREDATSEGLEIGVLDNGTGMGSSTLRRALQFGGTDRFDDRKGYGRFGMGLPNSSVSQSTRIDVYTWRRNRGTTIHTYLDVDKIAAGEMTEVPQPCRRRLPVWARDNAAESGTLVVWGRCDRVSFRKKETLAKRLSLFVGQVYRHAIWRGLRITVNGSPVKAVDPLHRRGVPVASRAEPYGRPFRLTVLNPNSNVQDDVTVRFTVLPVDALSRLPGNEKRRMGVVGRAGASIVRAGRQIDYGWHFFGSKRKENYDDWWRCEIQFPPTLDELFGVTNSKQGIRPTRELKAALSPDLEAIARRLNIVIREQFEALKRTPAAKVAAKKDQLMPPVITQAGRTTPDRRIADYRIEPMVVESGDILEVAVGKGKQVVYLNTDHPFYRKVYLPAISVDPDMRFRLECIVLALARAEVDVGKSRKKASSEYLERLSDAMGVYLGR